MGAGDTHLLDPVNIGRHTGEDHGLLVCVAASTGTKAHDAMHLPQAVFHWAVQWATRVSLHPPDLLVQGVLLVGIDTPTSTPNSLAQGTRLLFPV